MQNQLNHIVNCGDHICASIDCNGRRLASVIGTNFSSIESIKRALLDMAGTYAGIAMLTVRNVTRGWRDISALATMRRPMVALQDAPFGGSLYVVQRAS